jgi:FixJ family two-component response regulator
VSKSDRFVVAVVDDDPRLLESLENLLQSAGYEVRTHGSAESLIAEGFEAVDCVITDIGMPVMDGLQLRDQIGQVRPALPVFLISGRHDLSGGKGPGFQDSMAFFRKPFDGQVLLAAVEAAIQRAQGGRAQ